MRDGIRGIRSAWIANEEDNARDEGEQCDDTAGHGRDDVATQGFRAHGCRGAGQREPVDHRTAEVVINPADDGDLHLDEQGEDTDRRREYSDRDCRLANVPATIPLLTSLGW
ncbi:MAG TPA: hypothetical protein PLB92_09380 [Rhodoglobus sp.]|nr:hypothetical protein [Rhodoglobus sp.]